MPRRVRERAPVGGPLTPSSGGAGASGAIRTRLLDANIVLDVILARAPLG
jgi:hypothetical protein